MLGEYLRGNTQEVTMSHRKTLWTRQGVSFLHAVTKETLDVLPSFQIRDDDIVVASYPKTGTNWLIEIVIKILRAAGKTEESSDTMTVGPMEVQRLTALQPGYMKLAELPSPRLVMTHLPIQFAPNGISKPQNKVKVLVPMRNPKDTAVSMFHFLKYLMQMMGEKDDLRWEDFVQDFSSGIVPYGDFCDHVSGWWQMREDPHFLFLKYEDMKKDLLSAVKTIVTFLGVDLDESTVKGIAEASTFNNMKPDLDNAAAAERRHIARKGIVGDWKNYFSTEESEVFDAWCEKKLAGTGPTFEFE
ncbi:SULT2A1 [Branchiostoma lanceolatum]|uniref:Sulfotransferase n=1 Tax=Branchiostoma lanceolatum TaxID=7740 RepID=A0A8K0A2X0_BRALA|nr:SULT2A1 [Branchiostoma lanceolatum]